MTINLSDETLDHLRYHLARYRDATKKLGDKAKRKADIARYQLHLDQLNDLLIIFAEADLTTPALPQPPVPDVRVSDQGTVFHFALRPDADGLVDFVKGNFALESWQWLGKHAFAVDHRFAPQTVAVLRDGGFNVEVQ